MTQELATVLHHDPGLRPLLEAAQRLSQLQNLYGRIAPVSLGRSSRVIRFEPGSLTLAADNSAVAAKLRQMAPDLAARFRERGLDVATVQVRVSPYSQPPRKPTVSRELSEHARQEISQLRDTLPDSPLRSALQKLAIARAGKLHK